MRIGMVGAGNMGREIEAMAGQRGHEVVWRLRSKDNVNGSGLVPERLRLVDVVFEFTSPQAARSNLMALAAAGARVVCGTTGWLPDLPAVAAAFVSGGGALVYASNFSVGVRHFFELAGRAAGLYAPAGYSASIAEEHHAGKKDAPSGTARVIAEIVGKHMAAPPPISSVRSGTIPGTHRLLFESPEDEVELTHRAKGRAGFARGAVWAAERIAGRSGVFEFAELLKEVS